MINRIERFMNELKAMKDLFVVSHFFLQINKAIHDSKNTKGLAQYQKSRKDSCV